MASLFDPLRSLLPWLGLHASRAAGAATSMRVTAASLVDHLAGVYGDRVAYRLAEPLGTRELGGTDVRYSDLARFVRGTAAVLAGELGVRLGDRVVVCAENRLDAFLAALAVVRLGGVAVPLNAMLRPEEIEYIVGHAHARHLLVDARTWKSGLRGKAPDGVRPCFLGPAAEVKDGHASLDALLSRDAGDSTGEPAPVDHDQTVLILYTSGTTGRPKGARLPSRAITQPLAPSLLMPLRPAAFTVSALPRAHVMGFLANVAALMAGVPMYDLARFDAGTVLDALERTKATVFLGVPSMYAMLEQAGAAHRDLRSVALWLSAADAMPRGLIDRFRSYGHIGPFKAVFVEVYGMVELGGPAFAKVYADGIERVAESGCVGVPIPTIRTRIVDDDGRDVARGEAGELVASGATLLRGYEGEERDGDGASFLPDGFFRTGDIVRRGPLGTIEFLDRKKDVVKCGGYSVFCAEVEEHLRRHPVLKSVAVFGVPDAKKGEVPIAAVVLREGAAATSDELVAWAKSEMAPYKAPRAVWIVTDTELPFGSTGKVLKRELRARYLATS